MNTAFEIRDFSVGYSTRTALENVSIQIPNFATTAILGPSGSGKSTFLASLNRLIEMIPSAWVRGEIFFKNKSVYEYKNLSVLRQQVGMIFQKPTVFPVSIFENIALAVRERGIKNKTELQSRVEIALRQAALWEETSHRLSESACSLSEGQKQRLCIARALALNPDVLLMDEPCSSLDPLSNAKIEDLINELKSKMTIVIVTHNLQQAQRIADKIAVFWVKDDVGLLLEDGPAQRMTARCKELFLAPNF